MKKVVVLIIILFGVLLGIAIAQNYLQSNNSFFTKSPTQTIGDKTLKLDIAKTNEEREIGLTNKNSLADDRGMLFIFEKPDYYSFWMKNMKFPIDIIFIRGDTIVTIYTDVQPPISSDQSIPIYQPKSPADSVLEINAGLSKKYNFKEGDKVKNENFGN